MECDGGVDEDDEEEIVVRRTAKKPRHICIEDDASSVSVYANKEPGENEEDGGDEGDESDESDADSLGDFIVDDDDSGEDSEEDDEEEDDEDSEEEYEEDDDEEEQDVALTQDEQTAEALRECQQPDASDAGYDLLTVVQRIQHESYRVLESEQTILIREKVGVSFGPQTHDVVNTILCLLRWLDLISTQGGVLSDPLPNDVLELIVGYTLNPRVKLIKGKPIQDPRMKLIKEKPTFYVVSTDKLRNHNYARHLLPLILSIFGVHITADLDDDRTFGDIPPWASGFERYAKIQFPKGCFGSVGCLCRQKHLGNLYGVRHQRSGVVVFVGSSCIVNFGFSSQDEWVEKDRDDMPAFLRTVYTLDPTGLTNPETQRVVRRVHVALGLTAA